MEKERFLELTRNFTALTAAETKDLDALQKEYPYSQIIHNLVSRGAQDNKLETFKNQLNISAVYSTDRGVLKNIITAPKTERGTGEILETTTVIESVVITEVVRPEVVEVVTVTSDESIGLPNDHHFVSPEVEMLSGDALNAEIMVDLNRLQELKNNFTASVEEFESGRKAVVKETKTRVSSKDTKKKKEEVPEAEPVDTGLIEELKTKKKLVPETEKQKEQIDIIDRFIKKQPSIQKGIGAAVDRSDLAEKTLTHTDSIVSETLVEILLKQGKKDKAIEMLKKLIWKFPQKKAIFAAQIDELKK